MKILVSGMYTNYAHLNKLPRRRAIVLLVWGMPLTYILPCVYSLPGSFFIEEIQCYWFSWSCWFCTTVCCFSIWEILVRNVLQ